MFVVNYHHGDEHGDEQSQSHPERENIQSRVVTNDQKTSIYKATRLMYVFIDLLQNDTDNYFVSRSRMFHSYWYVTILLAKEMFGAYCV